MRCWAFSAGIDHKSAKKILNRAYHLTILTTTSLALEAGRQIYATIQHCTSDYEYVDFVVLITSNKNNSDYPREKVIITTIYDLTKWPGTSKQHTINYNILSLFTTNATNPAMKKLTQKPMHRRRYKLIYGWRKSTFYSIFIICILSCK